MVFAESFTANSPLEHTSGKFITQDVDSLSAEERQQFEERSRELYLEHGDDVSIDDIESAEEWKALSADRRAELEFDQIQPDHPAERMFKSMAGPAATAVVGSAVAASGLGAAGIAGAGLLAGAKVAGSGSGTFLLQETANKGVRGAYDSAKTAVTDSARKTWNYGKDTVNKYSDHVGGDDASDAGSAGTTNDTDSIR